ncbi:MAG TPA: hypothetical protein VGI40_16675 [Pirellulaceae bacterium]|jgi:hypothetical protein
MRSRLLFSVIALIATTLSSVTGEEPKQPDASRLKLFCSMGKDGMMILPAQPEQSVEKPNQWIITCDSMLLASEGGFVLKNAAIEMKDGVFEGKELAILFGEDLRSINITSPDGRPLRDMRFTKKPDAAPPK